MGSCCPRPDAVPNDDVADHGELALVVELLRHDPFFFRITLPVASPYARPQFDCWALLGHLADRSTREVLYADFRAVDTSRWIPVLRSGVDVEPPDAPIFVGPFEKAWEYGGWPKLVMAFDPFRLDRTFRQVGADIPPEEVERVRGSFPTVLQSADGETLWLSRLAASDPRVATPYESEYGRWIPGNAREALRAVMLFTSRDRDDFTEGLDELLREVDRTEHLAPEHGQCVAETRA